MLNGKMGCRLLALNVKAGDWQAAGALWPRGRALWHQLVTARFGDQDGRAGGVFLDLLPQPVDVGLECVSGEPGIVAPDFLQQGLARDRTLAGPIKISQYRGLLLREPHLAARRIEQDFRARPECIGADGEDGVLARLVLAQLRANACEQHVIPVAPRFVGCSTGSSRESRFLGT